MRPIGRNETRINLSGECERCDKPGGSLERSSSAAVASAKICRRSCKMNNSMRSMRVLRGISQSVCIVSLLLACGALSAQNQEHHVRNIVLVHGAWADGSGW